MSFTNQWADVTGSPGDNSGDFEPTFVSLAEQLKKGTGTGKAILAGQVISWDLTGKIAIVCPTTGMKGPFYYCIVDAPEAQDWVEAVPAGRAGNFINTLAGDAIGAGKYVKPSATTAGRVDEWIQGTHGEDLKIGKYNGKPRLGEGDGETFATDAAAGDVVRVETIGGT